MKSAREEPLPVKVVVLFQPEELAKKTAMLCLLHIQKKEGRSSFFTTALHRKDINQFFESLPDEAKKTLLQFHPDELAAQRKEAELRYKKQKAGVSQSVFLQHTFFRHAFLLFQQLAPCYTQIRWYHKVRKAGGQVFQTLSCTFSAERPRLQLAIEKKEELYTISVQIIIADNSFRLEQFVRTVFFLQKDNAYYLLSFKDYQTLEWLQENLATGLKQDMFVEKIVSHLDRDYSIQRKDLLEGKKIESLPRCRVLLSELNQAFLLFTPQWFYDDILVDGPWQEQKEISAAGKRIVIQRHKEAEEDFLKLLGSLHPNFSAQRNGYFYLTFADAQKKQWFAKTYYFLLENNVDVAGMDLLQHFRYSPHKIETTVTSTQETGSTVSLQMKVCFGKETVSLGTLQKALHAGQRAIVLKDGSLGILPDEWMERYALLLKHGRVQAGNLSASKFLLFGNWEQATAKESWQQPTKEDWRERWQKWQTGNEPVVTLPSTIKAELRGYQRKGFEWLVLLSQVGAGACLADDMGLGKTLQTICFLAWYAEQFPEMQQIIVCPTSLLYNWQWELQKFAPALKVELYHGASRQTFESAAQIMITSYGTLRSNSDYLLAKEFGVAVLDESHNIKNPSAQVTQVTQRLNARINIALSGTPVVNNTFDLYSQLNFALPGLLGTQEFFKREYAIAIDHYGDEAKLKALRRLTAPFILRRTKEQVASHLPSKTEAVLWCTMSPLQEELYNEVKEQVRSNLFEDIRQNGLQKNKLAVLQGLLKLRQICNHPALLPADEHNGRLDSAKTEMLMNELLHLLRKHKVLVFSQFASMLQLLVKECHQHQIDFFLLDGQTPADKRMQMVKDFQENTEAPSLFLISLKAGNTGLTLTAADYVFLFDPWWNTAVEQQAVDRTHRIGQDKNVFSYKLICKNTVEERILELQQRKKQLADELITAEEDFVKNLGEEEIAYLFA